MRVSSKIQKATGLDQMHKHTAKHSIRNLYYIRMKLVVVLFLLSAAAAAELTYYGEQCTQVGAVSNYTELTLQYHQALMQGEYGCELSLSTLQVRQGTRISAKYNQSSTISEERALCQM